MNLLAPAAQALACPPGRSALGVLNAQQTYRQVALAYVAAAKLLQNLATLEGAVDAAVESAGGPNVIRLQVEDIMRIAASAK